MADLERYRALCSAAQARGVRVELHTRDEVLGSKGKEYRELAELRVTRADDKTMTLASCGTSLRTLDADADVLLRELAA